MAGTAHFFAGANTHTSSDSALRNFYRRHQTGGINAVIIGDQYASDRLSHALPIFLHRPYKAAKLPARLLSRLH